MNIIQNKTYRENLVSPGQPLTCYAGRGSGQTRMLHSCLTRHSFCGVLTTGKVYKVWISVVVSGFLKWVKLIKTEVLTYFIHFACG